MAASDSLEGLTIGIPATRRAEETAQLVRRWGGIPLIASTFREVAAGGSPELLDATRSVIDASPPWSVHLTGVGTGRWFEVARKAGLLDDLLGCLQSAGIVARGQKARAALARAGLEPAWIPPGETSVEIAEWLVPRLAVADVVVVQLHGEPAPELAGAIEGTGARVLEIRSYWWDVPDDLEPARRLIRSMIEGKVHALLITSAPQVKFLAEIAAGMGQRAELLDALDRRVFSAAVGSVAAGGLEELGLKTDLVAEPARMGALVRSLAAARDRVEAKAGCS